MSVSDYLQTPWLWLCGFHRAVFGTWEVVCDEPGDWEALTRSLKCKKRVSRHTQPCLCVFVCVCACLCVHLSFLPFCCPSRSLSGLASTISLLLNSALTCDCCLPRRWRMICTSCCGTSLCRKLTTCGRRQRRRCVVLPWLACGGNTSAMWCYGSTHTVPDTYTYRHRHIHIQTHTDTHRHRHTYRHTHRHTHTHTPSLCGCSGSDRRRKRRWRRHHGGSHGGSSRSKRCRSSRSERCDTHTHTHANTTDMTER